MKKITEQDMKFLFCKKIKKGKGRKK